MTERDIPEIDEGIEKRASVDAVYDWTDTWLTTEDIAERRGKNLLINTGNVIAVADAVRSLAVGNFLARNDEQLALPPQNYYPELDMRKETAEPVGVGVYVEGYNWSDGSSSRAVSIVFGYTTPAGDMFQEKIGLYASPSSAVFVNRSVFALEYSETGYEGHARQGDYGYTNEDIRAFLGFVDSLLEPTSTENESI